MRLKSSSRSGGRMPGPCPRPPPLEGPCPHGPRPPPPEFQPPPPLLSFQGISSSLTQLGEVQSAKRPTGAKSAAQTKGTSRRITRHKPQWMYRYVGFISP